jgi:N-acetylglucosaminyldiphosphoundecaprenol N-acetyl-beta-D-mannosaminyltransferase
VDTETFMHDLTMADKTERAPIAILGVPFDNLNTAEALALIGNMIVSRQPHYGAGAGVDFLMQARGDVELRRILFEAHLVLAGENKILRAAKVLGNPLPETVTVENLGPQLLAQAEQKNWRVALLAGTDKAAVAEKTRVKFPKLTLTFIPAPAGKTLLEMDHADILRKVREAKPDLLFVALGYSKQEKWIRMNYREARVPFALGIGENPEFLAGEPVKKSGAKNNWGFTVAVWKQKWRLRTKPSKAAPGENHVIPDPFGNFVIRAPVCLGAAEAQAFQAEWLRAVENSHVMFDLTETVFTDSTGIGVLIRLRKRSREHGFQFFLVAPRPAIEDALKLMKLDEFFIIQTSLNSARLQMENAARSPVVTSGVAEKELTIRWTGEVTALNVTELGMHTEAELSQVTAGMSVTIDLARVPFVDSTGIGLMLRFKKNLQRRDVILKFTNTSESVRNVLRHTQLEEFLLG